MPANHQPMICPYCGIPMNHHADKAVYASSGKPGLEAAESAEEVIEEFHTCPRCGRSGMREKR